MDLPIKYNANITEIDKKIKEEWLVDKPNISEFTDNSDLDKKMAALATKAELKSEQDEIVKAFDLGYFYGTNHFGVMTRKII